MASIIARSSGISLQRASRSSVVKAAVPSRPTIRRLGRQAKFVPRAEADTTVDTEQIVKDLGRKWDQVENKTQVVIYGIGALVALYVTFTVVGSVNRLPLLPRIFELIGLGYSSWFTWRYLLFKSSRQELIRDIDELKNKIGSD